jgi:crossover junction endodeoxyribonuclease RuvC
LIPQENNIAFDRIILGIDPGTIVMGYGIIGIVKKQVTLITLGVLHLEKYDDYALKLKKIFERTTGLIDEFNPDEMAIEAPFYGKNVQSMLKLGRAQGVAIAGAMSRQIIVSEYSPKKIKQSITGNGNATKEQVAGMLEHILKFKHDSKFMDATDGLAAAYCHFLQNKLVIPELKSTGKSKIPAKKKASSWESFVSVNPSRVKK